MSKPLIAIKKRPNDYNGLADLGGRVIVGITGNLYFTTPSPTVADLQTAVSDVTNAIVTWGEVGNRGSHDDLVDLRAKAVTLRNMLIAMAEYVQNTAQGLAGNDYTQRGVIINSSGFEMKSTRTPQGRLQMVQNFRKIVTATLDPNQVKLKWSKPLNTATAGNVKSYKVYRGTTNVFASSTLYANITDTVFIDTNTTNAPITWSYWVLAFNNAGDGVLSSDLTVTVLGV